MADATNNLIWALWFRTLQGALEGAPTILCGVVIAGLIRGIIGPEPVHRWFTMDPVIGPLRAGLTGVLLPLCSLAVLPLAWEFRRVGVPRGTIIAFLLSAPVTDLFTLVFGYQTLSAHGQLAIVAFIGVVAVGLAIPMGIGIVLGRFMPELIVDSSCDSLPQSESSRFVIAARTAARALSGRLLLFILIGLVGNGALALVRGGAMERAVHNVSWTGTLELASVSIPMYAPPAKGTALICELLLSREPLGRILVFVLLGVSLNLATFAWIFSALGVRTFVLTIPIFLGLALALGYTLPVSPLRRMDNQEVSFHSLEIEAGGTPRMARMRAMQTTVTDELGHKRWLSIAACSAIGALALAGLFTRLLGNAGNIPFWLASAERPTADATQQSLSRRLTSAQVAAVLIVTLILALAAGMFFCFPSHDDLLDQMDDVEIELGHALKAEPIDFRATVSLVDRWRAIQQKLIIASVLRGDGVDTKLQSKSNDMRSALDRLRMALHQKDSADELSSLFEEARETATRYDKEANRKRTP